MKLGIGITSFNRPEVFKKCIRNIILYSPIDSTIVVVDDGSDEPVVGATYRFETNQGVATAKNKCIELLMEAGCTHLFLFDDDTYPIVENWWRPYINSGSPHLCMTFPQYASMQPTKRKLLGLHGPLAIYDSPCGCMLYATREVVEKVGYMDTAYEKWGYEHYDWTMRIHQAGFTEHACMDVWRSTELFHSMDYHQEVVSSVPDRAKYIRKNKALFESKNYENKN